MRIIHLMCGLPGSGKSTYIHNYAAEDDIVISRDQFRADLRKQLGSQEYFPVSANDEYRLWTTKCADIIAHAPGNGEIWIDQTSVSVGSITKFIKTVSKFYDLSKDSVIIEMMRTPLNECLRRNALRSGYELVPEKVILDMNKSFGDITTLKVRDAVQDYCHSILINPVI